MVTRIISLLFLTFILSACNRPVDMGSDFYECMVLNMDRAKTESSSKMLVTLCKNQHGVK